MAMMRYAKATVVRPTLSAQGWGKVRTAATNKAALSGNLLDQASSIFGKPFDPSKYLLTHATIVASVNTEKPANVKLGSVEEDGFRVNRKYANYRVTGGTEKYINNNMDCWDRQTLLKSYRTFIGAHNFVEHVQIEDLSKGRIIDAVARDIGDSVYVDILVATERKHTELVDAIQSGKMATMSMGCFTAGTQVTLADGRRVAIEDVQLGDMVLTHKGRAREVTNKQIRHGDWGMRRIHAVGIPNGIEATDNHPFFVIRPASVCACGCGEALPAIKGARRSKASMSRRFLRGHDKRILNPNGSYSLDEMRVRQTNKDTLRQQALEEVRADELQVGDYVCFPRSALQAEASTEQVAQARLLGYFLAEGSFLKRQGEPVEVQFNFSLSEKDTYAAEVLRLLQQVFPAANAPWVQERPDRNTCTVHLTGREVANWFYQHGGEYSHSKRLSADVLGWPLEAQRELLGAWVNGDGTYNKTLGSTSVVTTSYDLVCQMQMLMANCGLTPRMYCRYGGQNVEIRQVVNAGFVRHEANGRLPSYDLVLQKGQAVALAPYTDKCPSEGRPIANRVQDDLVMFPITAIDPFQYTGWVYDMEVEEDHSYVVEGVAVHNCTIDFSVCTKCGNVAVDETEMCSHVRYMKGNTFFDENGTRRKIAELCGHPSVNPTGGVTFIEASWVETPAFEGAVMRNVLEAKAVPAKVMRQAQQVLSTVPAKWDAKARHKKARALHLAEDDFGFGGEGGEAEGGEAAAPAAPAEPPNPFKDIEDQVQQHILTRVLDNLKQQVEKGKNEAVAPNDTQSTGALDSTLNKQAARKYLTGLNALVKTARSDIDLIDRVAAYNQSMGVQIPTEIYRAAVRVGSAARYGSEQHFMTACRGCLGRKLSAAEANTLLRLGKLLDLYSHHG